MILANLFLTAALAAPPGDFTVTSPPHSDGLNLQLSWTDPGGTGFAVLRKDAQGTYELSSILPAGSESYNDKVTTDPRKDPPRESYTYRVATLDADSALPPLADDDDDAAAANQARYVAELFDRSANLSPEVTASPVASWLNTSPGHLLLLLLIASVGGLIYWFTDQARKGSEIFIRRIPGIDAIEEGIGRATEMGKPVLYVPGIDELQDIQTIASMLILGQVAKTVAEYQSEIIVSCCIPIVREVADEVVKAGFYQAGHPDAYHPGNTRFISSEQFAFCAGTNGIMLREKPATNIYLGRFFAESLILAETGYINRSIQIAGTAEATQLPFFVAACDYTLIGEELFAVSAYLSRDPRLVSSLKASDYVKVFCVACVLLGTALASIGNPIMIDLFTIGE